MKVMRMYGTPCLLFFAQLAGKKPSFTIVSSGRENVTNEEFMVVKMAKMGAQMMNT